MRTFDTITPQNGIHIRKRACQTPSESGSREQISGYKSHDTVSLNENSTKKHEIHTNIREYPYSLLYVASQRQHDVGSNYLNILYVVICSIVKIF